MKRIGIAQLARIADVSLATADRAMNGREGISEKTREKVLRIAAEVGYKPNLAARAMAIGKRKFRIGICIPQEQHVFFDQIRVGLENEAQQSEDYGLQLIYATFKHQSDDIEKHIRCLMDQDIQALILSPGRSDIITPLIDEAESKGIRVICTPSDAPASKRSSVVGTNPEVSGRMAGELMSRFLQNGGDVAVLTGTLLGDVNRRKTTTFTQEYERRQSHGKVVEVIEQHEDESSSIEKTWSLLERRDSLKGIYVTNANCLPICYGLTAKNFAGKIALITTDLFPEMVPYFEKNVISASIYQQPYQLGQYAMRVAIGAVMRDTSIQNGYALSPQIVMAANIHLFREIAKTDHIPYS